MNHISVSIYVKFEQLPARNIRIVVLCLTVPEFKCTYITLKCFWLVAVLTFSPFTLVFALWLTASALSNLSNLFNFV
jgi:hypothetical protein